MCPQAAWFRSISMRHLPGEARRVQAATVGLTIAVILGFSLMVLGQTARDRSTLRAAAAAGPTGPVPPPETGQLRRHKQRGGR